jgi:hypothetical protein
MDNQLLSIQAKPLYKSLALYTYKDTLRPTSGSERILLPVHPSYPQTSALYS